MPFMNIDRNKHSSCALGNNIYVVCGYDNGKLLNSFERLDTRLIEAGVAEWHLISVSFDILTPRCEPALCALNSDKLIILGGYRHGYCSDVVVFDERDMSCSVLVKRAPMEFWAFGN